MSLHRGDKEAALVGTSEQGGRLATFNRQSLWSRAVSESQKGQDLPGTFSAYTVHICNWISGGFAIPLNLTLGMGNGVESGEVFLCHSHSLRYCSPDRAMPKSTIDIHSGLLSPYNATTI